MHHFQADKIRKKKWIKIFGKEKIMLIDKIKDFIRSID